EQEDVLSIVISDDENGNADEVIVESQLIHVDEINSADDEVSKIGGDND
ncbi:unnamed protein product, partial [Rotaria sp. Silwood1]